MVSIGPYGTCVSYTQSGITYLDDQTPISGIKVLYLSEPITNSSQRVYLNYTCNRNVTIGCP